MTTSRFEEIKNMISKAENESARSEGVIDSIKNSWKKEYGFEDLESAENKLAELYEEQKKLEERKQNLENKLEESYDWDSLEEELNG